MDGGGEGWASRIGVRACLRVALAPGLKPWIGHLAWSVGLLVHLLAHVFWRTGLLAGDHPALAREAVGTFGMRDILQDAFDHVRSSDSSWEQALVFGVVVGSLVMVGYVGLVLVFEATTGVALAAMPTIAGDVGADAIRRVFAVSADVDGAIPAAIRKMVGVYAWAAAGAGAVVFLGTAVFLVGDVAMNGKDAQKHDVGWWLLRSGIALAMIVPIGGGFGAGQRLVLWGTDHFNAMASKAWAVFPDAIANQAQNGKWQAVGKPTVPGGDDVLRAVWLAEVCMAGFNARAAAAGAGETVQERSFGPWTRRYDRVIARGILPKASFCGQVKFSDGQAVQGVGAKQMQTAQIDAFMGAVPDVRSVAVQFAKAEVAGDLPPSSGAIGSAVSSYRGRLAQAITAARGVQNEGAIQQIQKDIKEGGWAMAGVWVTTIARFNIEFGDAAGSLPKVSPPTGEIDAGLAEIINHAQAWWDNAARDRPGTSLAGLTAVGADQGLLDHVWRFVRGYFLSASSVSLFQIGEANPLADLAATGQTINLVAEAMLGVFAAVAAGGIGKLAALAGPGGAVLGAIGGGWIADLAKGLLPIVNSIALTLFFVGGALAYFIPLLPMMRFLFGIISWLVMLAEAMAAMPVVGIAMMVTGDSGPMGGMGKNLGMLLLSIFLRPILMVYSMMIGIVLCSTGIWLLNKMFLPAVVGANASDSIGVFGFIGYSAAYLIMAYSVVNMSFKINDIPNGILRWVGGQVLSDRDDGQGVNQSAGSLFRDVKMGVERQTGGAMRRAGR